MSFKGEKFISKKVSFGGIVTLLIIVSLYMTSILPTLRIFFFALSSLFLSAMVMEFGVGYAFVTFGASSLLGIVLIPNKVILVPYILYFGYYGITKYYVEKINNAFFEWVLKIALFNLFTYFIYLIAKNLFAAQINVDFPFWIIIVLFQIIFIIYDYCYSIAVSYYKNHIRKMIIKR